MFSYLLRDLKIFLFAYFEKLKLNLDFRKWRKNVIYLSKKKKLDYISNHINIILSS